MTEETHDSYFYVYIGIQIQVLFTQTKILETVLTGPNQETTKQFSPSQSLIHLPRILKLFSVPLQLQPITSNVTLLSSNATSASELYMSIAYLLNVSDMITRL